MYRSPFLPRAVNGYRSGCGRASRVLLLGVLAAGHLLPSGVQAGVSAVAPGRPNLLVILVDDLGYGDLSCYPHRYPIETPHIDRIAQRGVRMTQAYAAFPVCAPTRTALMTGRLPWRDGVYGNPDGAMPGANPNLELVSARLQRAGYRTGWFGKWHLGWDLSNHPLNHGFDVGYGFLGGMHDYFDPQEGDHYNGGPFARHAWVFDGWRPVPTMGYLTDELTGRAIQFIRDVQGKQPFFIYLAYNAPHSPLQAPDEAVLRFLRVGEDAAAAVRRAMIDVLDRNIGRLLDTLAELAIDDQTLVVFHSDNGATNELYNGPLRGRKMSVLEGGLRSPLLACWPGHIPPATTCDALAVTCDITATLLAQAQVEVPAERLDGVDLLPYWTGRRQGDAHASLVWCIQAPGPAGARPTLESTGRWAVRRGPWKLLRDKELGEAGLYHVLDDPAERVNREAEQPELAGQLLQIYAAAVDRMAPAAAALHRLDTRADGDQLKMQQLRQHCRELLESAGAPQ